MQTEQEHPHSYESHEDWLLKHHQQVWFEPWKVIEERKQELREKGESLVERFGTAPLPTEYGDFTLVGYGDRTTGEEHYALVYGNLENGSLGEGEDILTRIHSSCVTSEIFGATNCDCPEQKAKALEDIAAANRGVFVYLHQEGRGNGTSGKLMQLTKMFEFNEDGSIVDTGMDTDTAFRESGYEGERRDFAVAGDILLDLGVKSVILETNNPSKINGTIESGVAVTRRESCEIPPKNGVIARDLEAKRDKLGHLITGDMTLYVNGNGK